MKFRQRLEKFMYGRYGVDKFGIVLLCTALALMIVNSFVHSLFIYLLEIFLLVYHFFRSFSRNIAKRYRENEKFEETIKKINSFFKLRKAIWKDRKTHVYTKCPSCKANIRLPRKVGHHRLNCPKCHTVFEFECRK